ncbi:putative excisionase [Escherichia coli]|nr:putative excisionase [Escherichia coli]STG73483.1 putative excisionase [Escherichia coli]
MIVSPGKWVSEEQLIALKGIKKGTLKKAREKIVYGRKGI